MFDGLETKHISDVLYVLASHTGLIVAASVYPEDRDVTPTLFTRSAVTLWSVCMAGPLNFDALWLGFMDGMLPTSSKIRQACAVQSIVLLVVAFILAYLQLAPSLQRIPMWTFVRSAVCVHGLVDASLLAFSLGHLHAARAAGADTFLVDVETRRLCAGLLFVGPPSLMIAAALTPANRLRASHLLGRAAPAPRTGATRHRRRGARRHATKPLAAEETTTAEETPPDETPPDETPVQATTAQATNPAAATHGEPRSVPPSAATRFRAADALVTRYLSGPAVLIGPAVCCLAVVAQSFLLVSQNNHLQQTRGEWLTSAAAECRLALLFALAYLAAVVLTGAIHPDLNHGQTPRRRASQLLLSRFFTFGYLTMVLFALASLGGSFGGDGADLTPPAMFAPLRPALEEGLGRREEPRSLSMWMRLCCAAHSVAWVLLSLGFLAWAAASPSWAVLRTGAACHAVNDFALGVCALAYLRALAAGEPAAAPPPPPPAAVAPGPMDASELAAAASLLSRMAMMVPAHCLACAYTRARRERAARWLQSRLLLLVDDHEPSPPAVTSKTGGGSGGGGDDDEAACVVCLDAGVTHVLAPCGHKCVCAECAARLLRLPCPLCRVPVESLVEQVFTCSG